MGDSLAEMAVRLTANGIRFRRLRRAGKGAKPRAVSIEVTRRCIARCRMCNIWRTPREAPTLSAETWLALLAGDLFTGLVELDVTGGEPFLREDLADLLTGVCERAPGGLPSLRSIAVTTNGFLTRRVVEGCGRVLSAARRAGVSLVVVCAMDAVGDRHDAVRGFPGGWERVDRTLTELGALRASHPHLILGLKTTVLPETVGELDGIVRYAGERGLFTILSPCIVTRGRYRNAELAADLAFGPDQVRAMARFFEGGPSLWTFHERALVHYFRTGRMKKPCTCGFNYFFVRSDGALFLCPMIEASPGNVTETPLPRLLASGEAARIRRRVGRFPECRDCTEPGLERYSLPYEGWTYLSMLPRLGRKRFLRMHRHMGLDKHMASGS